MKAAKGGSSRNAMKCGIFAKILLSGVVMGEHEQDYRDLLSGLRRQFRPANPHEDILVDKLAYLYLRLTRIYKSDIRLAGKLFKKVERALEVDQDSTESRFVGENKDFEIVTFSKGPSPELLIRYEAHIEREISRTLDQLERFQRMRERPPEPPRENWGTGASRAQ